MSTWKYIAMSLAVPTPIALVARTSKSFFPSAAESGFAVRTAFGKTRSGMSYCRSKFRRPAMATRPWRNRTSIARLPSDQPHQLPVPLPPIESLPAETGPCSATSAYTASTNARVCFDAPPHPSSWLSIRQRSVGYSSIGRKHAA